MVLKVENYIFPIFFVFFFSFLKKAKIWIGSSWDVLIIWKKETKYLCYSYMYTGWRWQTRCPKHSNVEEFGFMWGLIGKRIIEWKLLHLVKDLFLSQTECGTELLTSSYRTKWLLTSHVCMIKMRKRCNFNIKIRKGIYFLKHEGKQFRQNDDTRLTPRKTNIPIAKRCVATICQVFFFFFFDQNTGKS